MHGLTIKHNDLSAEQFIFLWGMTHWGEPPAFEQVELAMNNSIFRVSVFDGEKIVGMARMIGDFGLCYYIKDVAVIPEYQRRGIGRLMIEELLKFIESNGVGGTEIFVELCAMPKNIPFYERFGFSANEAQRLRRTLRIPKPESL